MRALLRVVSWMVLVAAVGWTLLAIGNGKTGEIFGAEFFIASQADIMIAFVLNGAAAAALLVLGVTRRSPG